MTTPTRIDVGVDGSDASLDAARWATTEAILRGAPIELVTSVLSGPDTFGGAVGLRGPVFKSRDAEANQVLSRAVDVVHSQPGGHGVPLSTRIARGSAVGCLLNADIAPAMIVVGSRGLGDVTGGLIGSVSTAVAMHASCPVTVVKSAGVDVGPVVVGVDCSPKNRPAIELALAEASLRGVDLVAVHAWSDLELASPLTRELVTRWWEAEAAENVSMAESLAGCADAYPDVRIRRVVAKDRPVHEIVRECRRAQLVVMGSRGRGGVTAMLLGSTSRAVLHNVDIPVIIVRTRP